MTGVDDVDRRFREATFEFWVEPVRWNLVAWRVRWRALILGVASVILALVSTALLAGGLLAGKSAVDPSFQSLFANQHATLSVTFDEPHAARGHARLGQFLASTGRSITGLSTRQLDEEGFVFKVSARLVGYRGSHLLAGWSVLDAETRRVIPVDFHMSAIPVSPRHSRQRVPLRLWVPYAEQPGKFIVRFQLADAGSGSVVVARDSPPFVAQLFKPYRTPRYTATLPRDWTLVQDFQEAPGGRFVSRATAPGGLSVVIDTTPEAGGDPADSAKTLESRHQVNISTYRRLVFQRETLGTGSAFEWGFVADGVWTTDIFLARGGDGYAVKAVGPRSRYSETRSVARAVARSLRDRPS